MNIFKNNTWTLYFIITLILSLILGTGIYIKKNILLRENRSQQLYLLNVFENNFIAQLTEQAFILDFISDNVLGQDQINSRQIDALLEKNKLLSNLNIFSPAGLLIYPDKPAADSPVKKAWLKKVRESEQMVVGNPYFLAQGTKILPLGKRILDPQGKTIALLTTELNLENLARLWQSGTRHLTNIQITQDKTYTPILNLSLNKQVHSDSDNQNKHHAYRNYHSEGLAGDTITPFKATNHKLLFQSALPEPIFTPIYTTTSQIPQFLTALRATEQPYQATLTTKDEQRSLFVITFNKEYNLWFSVETRYAQINNALNEAIIYYTLIYLIVLVILFSLFLWIARIEKEKLQDITYKARYDLLTGLYNRSELEAQFHHITKKENTYLSLLYVDLGNFKSINDNFGYSYGDLVLKQIAARMTNFFADLPGDVFRHHGDKFVILVKTGDLALIKKYATRLLQFMTYPYVVCNNQLQINATIGVANYPNHADNIETLLTYAENSGYYKRKQTLNNVTFFSLEDHHRLMQKKEVEKALHKAIENREISLVYQPQVCLDNKLCGVEALVRWNSKKLGFIPPDMFIPIAEKIGLMPELGYYILCTALQEMSLFHQNEHTSFTLSVNVSVKQFMQVDFFKKLLQACDAYKKSNINLILEITESLFIENLDRLLPSLKELKRHNIRLSLDDFGTGYSSLSMLRQVPIDELKIDKSFIDHIADSEKDRIMLASIIKMGKKLEMTVLAEGVETEEQFKLLRKAGCDLYQGYYFSKPCTLTALSHFVASSRDMTFHQQPVNSSEEKTEKVLIEDRQQVTSC